ncbi:hypothetical protein [Streptomyces qinzhouensis]|uniref:Flp family type IVb pilin n=1 Tax=Streptomyces qinzhouensis TaxID=2599401 RepID=A0A5B8JBH5_9ACTN|nr:hypothetical protein [Streptomyces qinzhouensis]QDY78797.1 hypothetical protein FQU76_22355 [Streptomyces qinzhouensis]
MSNVTLKALVKARVHLGAWTATRVQALRQGRDRGQGAVEYVGVIVLVAIIIAAVAGSGVGDDIANGLKAQVQKVLNTGGGK